MLNSVARKLFLWFSFIFAFVINPAYVVGCDDDQDVPDFGEAEMVALLSDLNSANTTFMVGDAAYEVDLTLIQKGGEDAISSRGGSRLVRSAHACGSRTFLRSAAACATITVLGVEGSLTVRRVDGAASVIVVQGLPVKGEISAGGTTLKYPWLDLTFAGGSASWITDDAMHFDISNFNAVSLGPDSTDINYP